MNVLPESTPGDVNSPDRGGEDLRVAELMRVNAELAAELRSLALGQTDAPRSGATTTARRLGVILDERQSLGEQLEATKAELEATRAARDGLERQNREMAAEIARLSAGLSGLARRVRGRLLGG